MATLPKLENRIEVANGSGTDSAWRCVLTETGGGAATGNVDIAAAYYYLTSTDTGSDDLLGALATALDGIGNATYTCSLSDDDDSGTGKVTISCTGGSVTAFQIEWTDTALRDALGFTGTISGATSHESPSASPYLWLPNCNRRGDHPDPAAGDTYFGRRHEDTVSSIAPSGAHVSARYNTVYRSSLEFPSVLGKKAWTRLESVTNESFETFWANGAGSGGLFRYHTDRSDDTEYWTLWIPNGQRLPVEPLDPAFMASGSVHAISFETYDHVAG